MTICSTFLMSISISTPSSPATSEGVFAEILPRPFGIYNKLEALFDLSLKIWRGAGFQGKIKICQKTLDTLNVFASPGQDLVNFDKKY